MEKVYANGPKIHKYLKEMNSKILKKYDIVTVGEGPELILPPALNMSQRMKKN